MPFAQEAGNLLTARFSPSTRSPCMTLDAFAVQILAQIAAHMELIKAAVLGIVEGFTEFLPVSSTGHLLLMEHVLGWGDTEFGKTFAVLIQLGAILALLS